MKNQMVWGQQKRSVVLSQTDKFGTKNLNCQSSHIIIADPWPPRDIHTSSSWMHWAISAEIILSLVRRQWHCRLCCCQCMNFQSGQKILHLIGVKRGQVDTLLWILFEIEKHRTRC